MRAIFLGLLVGISFQIAQAAEDAAGDASKDAATKELIAKNKSKRVTKQVKPVEAAAAPTEVRLAYPELEVTPRASERLELEARRENSNRWFVHAPILFSSLMTILASNQAEYEPGDGSATEELAEQEAYDDKKSHALYVGSAWFVATAAVAAAYRPYKTGYDEIRNLPKDSVRDQLTRERLSEEALYRPSTLATTLKWLSVMSQLFINVRLIPNGTDKSTTFVGLATLSALAPLVFESTWNSVAENHKLYKKKIYGPVSGPVLLPEEGKKPVLGWSLAYSF